MNRVACRSIWTSLPSFIRAPACARKSSVFWSIWACQTSRAWRRAWAFARGPGWQKKRGPAPAFQGPGMSRRGRREVAPEIELAAVAAPPALSNGEIGQARRQPLPILTDEGDVADGPDLLTLMGGPVAAGGFHYQG